MVFMKFGDESETEFGVDSSELDEEEEEEDDESIPKLNSDFSFLAADFSKLGIPSSFLQSSSSDCE